MTTTISTGHYFTLSQFDKLVLSRNSPDIESTSLFSLDSSVLSTIDYLNTHIEIPDFPVYTSRSESVGGRSAYATTGARHTEHASSTRPQYQRGGGGASRNRKEPANTLTTEDWEMMRSFKTTKMDVKTGVEKTINDIRIHLNKMSTTNYPKQRDTIIAEIRNYADGEREPIERIASAIFDIASGNKFFSELYAELYRELVEVSSVFADILASFVNKFPETITNIEYVDPDADYDGFCRVTKTNDKRKATTAFIINVMKKGLVSPESVLNILCGFTATVSQYIGEPDRIHQIEEIVENIFLFVSMCSVDFREYPTWKECVVHTILSITENKQPRVSMSNRVLFKFMDMTAFTK